MMIVRTLFAAMLLLLSTSSALGRANGETGIRQLLAAYLHAWDRADASALASNFESQGDFVSPDGLYAQGRNAITSFYSAAFKRGYAHSYATFKIRKIRMVDENFAIVDGVWAITNAHEASGARRSPERGLAVVLLRKSGGEWKILALREQESASDFQGL